MKIFKKEQLKVEVLTRKQLLVVVGGDDVTESTDSNGTPRTKDGTIVPPRN
ncbi:MULTISPECIES: hypothetical protein [Flavobacterium]|uniref:Bacteriocin n=1 Tax=Flavobacterium jumunjinense TaxID=998845 RepID=A0ABV5GUH5_9FLAO|nr:MULTISPECIES: hypothetical protein [Flavobacterium]